jgi:hypothetical protein
MKQRKHLSSRCLSRRGRCKSDSHEPQSSGNIDANRKKGKKNYRLGVFSLATPTCWGSISFATGRVHYADFRNGLSGTHSWVSGGRRV